MDKMVVVGWKSVFVVSGSVLVKGLFP